MALHDRLRPPTLETPPVRAGHGLLVALVLVVLAAGFAYAMPRVYPTSAAGSTTEAPEVIVSATPLVTPTATVSPDPEPTEPPDDEGAEEGAKENHGKAVSTAAHCEIHGKAHGELVRSIARDKDAIVADAEAACAAAIAGQEAAPDKEHGKPDHADKVKEKDHSAPPGQSKQQEGDDGADPVETDSDPHGKPDKPKH